MAFLAIKCVYVCFKLSFLHFARADARALDFRITFVVDITTTYDVALKLARGIGLQVATASDVAFHLLCLAGIGLHVTTAGDIEFRLTHLAFHDQIATARQIAFQLIGLQHLDAHRATT